MTHPVNPAPGLEPLPGRPPEEAREPDPIDDGPWGPVQPLDDGAEPEREAVDVILAASAGPAPGVDTPAAVAREPGVAVEAVLAGAPPGPAAGVEPEPAVVASAVAVATEETAAVAVVTAGQAFAAKSAQAEATAERLVRELGETLRPGMKDEVQKETAALMILISDLAYEEFTEFFPMARVAVKAVTASPPNLTMARRIRRDIRWRTHLLLRPLLFLRTGHPAVQVILGLSTNLYLALPLALLLLPPAVRGSLFPGSSDQTFVLVGVAGAVGSIVSMLVRIQDFDNQQAEHRAILFFTGLFKPVIGIASALFMVIILEAGLIPLGIEDADQRVFFFLALAFVAGFSERLASDIITQAEGTVLSGGSRGEKPQG